MNPTKRHSAPLAETRLLSIVLNFGEKRFITRALFESDVTRLATIVGVPGQAVPEDFGGFHLRTIPADGHTIIGLKSQGAPVALAGLATKQYAAEILWDELLQRHFTMLQAQGRPIRDFPRQVPPSPLPWLLISLAPSYIDRTSALDLHRTLSVLWATAFACLDSSSYDMN